MALPLRVVERSPGYLAIICANAVKAKTELDWDAKLTVEDAIRDTLNYLEHQDA